MRSPTKQRYRVLDLVPQVILLRAEGKSLNEIASLMNLTKQRISQVVQIAKRHEAIQARWGFPFSVRTDRILEDLAVKSKDDALQLYRTGHLFPGAIWSFGHVVSVVVLLLCYFEACFSTSESCCAILV